MAESRVIFLVLTVIVVGSLAVLSFQMIQKSNLGIQELWKKGKSFQKRTSPIDLYSACSDWLSAGSEAYNAKQILEVFKVHEYMKPYSSLWKACGSTMEYYAKKCAGGGGRHGECNGEYIIADNLEDCVVTCENVKKIYEMCKSTCPEKLTSCFNYLITAFGASEFRRGISINDRILSKACGG